jgi:ribulose-5-phosphate 4-epimerase/fuculose-1-phosphate aldolase
MSDALAREALCRIGRRLYDRFLVHGSSGNISQRLDDGWLVTPTNSCLGDLDPARLARLDESGQHIAGDPPSKEAFLHTCVYEVRAGVNAVIHTHSSHAVAVSCLERPEGVSLLPPLTAYFVMRVGELANVPYFAPGDRALALAVREAAATHGAMLLANHGPVIAGTSLDQALYALEELEETAKLHLLLRGSAIRPLTQAQVDELEAD